MGMLFRSLFLESLSLKEKLDSFTSINSINGVILIEEKYSRTENGRKM